MQQKQSPWHIVHSEASMGWGGQEHRVLAELTGFKARGHRVSLFAPAASVIAARAADAGVEVVPLGTRKFLFPVDALKIARWLRRERADVVNPHSSRDGWLVGLAARLAGVPLVIRSRHIDVEYPNAWLSRHAFTTLADHVLTTSAKITAHLGELFHIPPDRISTIPTGINLNRFSPQGPIAELPAGITCDGPFVGMISVLRSWKGHGTFFEAARLLSEKGFHGCFLIVGGGAPVENFQKIAAEHGMGDRIVFVGHREDVDAWLRRLDVLVIPSTKHEGIPQIGLQALACQTPVVGSDTGGIPEIIQPGRTGRIFPSGNAAALAESILSALSDRVQTREFATAGRRMIEERYSLDAMLDQLEAVYRRYLTRA